MMTGHLKDLVYDRDGNSVVSITINGNFTEEFNSLQDKLCKIEIKEYRKSRSLDANAYCWVLIDKLATKLRLPKEQVYKEIIRHIGGVSEIVCVQEKAYETLKRAWESKGIGWQVETIPSKIKGCINAVLWYGSSVFDTKQMSDLIHIVVQECEAQGIPTATEEEILRFLK